MQALASALVSSILQPAELQNVSCALLICCPLLDATNVQVI